MDNQKKILITSFEPFGLRKIFQYKNSSLEVSTIIEEDSNNAFSYLTLPVSSVSEGQLIDRLSCNDIDAIVSLGENVFSLSPTINLEPYAINTPLRKRKGRHLYSKFAKWYETHNKIRLKSKIGNYYCNRIYLLSLLWADKNHKIAIFIHIPFLGSRIKQAEEILRIIEYINKY